MSMITEQVEELREEADFIIETLDMQYPTTIGVAKIMKRAADTIEQLAAKVRAENNVSQPCEDAISREAVLQMVSKGCQELRGVYGRCEELINALPSVNPQEKTGHWIDDEFGSKCSCCGIYTHLDKFDRPMKFRHCSMCGAKMIESQESGGSDADND